MLNSILEQLKPDVFLLYYFDPMPVCECVFVCAIRNRCSIYRFLRAIVGKYKAGCLGPNGPSRARADRMLCVWWLDCGEHAAHKYTALFNTVHVQ